MKYFLRELSVVIFLLIFSAGCENTEVNNLKDNNDKLRKDSLLAEQKLNEANAKIRELEIEKENNRPKKVFVNVEVDKFKSDSRKWDVSGAPDIQGGVHINGKTKLFKDKKDSFTTGLEIDNVLLRKGDVIKISLYDKDFAANDLICEGGIEFKGIYHIEEKIGSATISIDIK